MFESLQRDFEGELYFRNTVVDDAIRTVYATDASVYQEKPMAVALPKSVNDIRGLINLASTRQLTIIPRAAGTSLAGQVVGKGLVVDISKNFTGILEINREEKWVRVQPGVIRDDLNAYLKPYGLMFGPETSTSSRAMIGGMIGNNSCGLHSIIWGTTRDNLLEVKALLSDGSEAVFGALTTEELEKKCELQNTEGRIYREILALVTDAENREAIRAGFPKKSVTRRNTGYALDVLEEMAAFEDDRLFNLSSLIAGSEGTLCFVTEARLKLIDRPPAVAGMVAVHTSTLHEALLANLIALKHGCSASELVDDFIMEFTKTNIEQSKNRFFIEGSPKAILMVEFFTDTPADLQDKAEKLIAALKENNLGYAYPILLGDDARKAWDVRKGGLGLLRNLPGDTQPVNLIEDCAVAVEDLPAYIDELEALLKKHEVQYSMYAHAGAGELHVEPMVNLKSTEGRALFRTILAETAALVKKYGGSLSGEHGDGRLRGEFIPFMMGDKNYALFKKVKQIFDPAGVFNKGKIVDTPPMNEFLRYEADKPAPQQKTVYDFSRQESMLRLAEKCSGSGDCRKTEITGGTMCPSYMATRSERDTTRARANILRQYVTASEEREVAGEEETKEILDLCLSCKACKSECPSSVDIAKMKGEFLQQYYDKNGVPFRARLIGNFTRQMRLAGVVPWAYNFIFKTDFTRRIANRIVGFHPDRSMPALHSQTLRNWFKNDKQAKGFRSDNKVLLFCDEFTDFNDVEVGKKLIMLLQKLGYQVLIPNHVESGRTYLSKGMIREAQKIAIQNVNLLKDVVTAEIPIIGVEPSAILTLKDEYLELVPENLREAAQQIAAHTYIFDEWFASEIDRGNISKEAFTTEKRLIKLHGHCHQKALSSLTPSKKSLSLPINYEVHLIPSGCCGMAGSFGYEAEHYEVSMQIGELVLFPTVRKQPEEVIIAAPGTSCRHQIKDGTGRIAKHPAEILYEALL
ncbi:FAD-binding and (Fe-S)-binding domain-containing protein [Emticicia sp. TH156]|uniref:FAD-binding and (Fe-S)-binding domain-containing protein n=1 Tax=Emticicia sp. TH156 TaxID=2067454 RepID=UPI000C779E86|nr:FAD-binding and (Fe-S)-binding domain-containing protein [Emticicia sp. TH156]PLK42521.1 FAD-binding oxidoreductase [Emticicia sp. TH156]